MKRTYIILVALMLCSLNLVGCNNTEKFSEKYENTYVMYTKSVENQLDKNVVCFLDIETMVKKEIELNSMITVPDEMTGVIVMSELGDMTAQKYIDLYQNVHSLGFIIWDIRISKDMKKAVYLDEEGFISIYDFVQKKNIQIPEFENTNLYYIDSNADTVYSIINIDRETGNCPTGELYIRENGIVNEVDAEVSLPIYQNIISDNGDIIYVSDIDEARKIGTLYLKRKNEDAIAVAEKVNVALNWQLSDESDAIVEYSISDSGGTITAFLENNDLFILFNEAEPVFIKDVDSCTISESGDAVAYLQKTDDKYRNDLYIIKKGEEPKLIASNVAQIQALNHDGSEIVYLVRTDEIIDGRDEPYIGELYLLADGEEPILLSEMYKDWNISLSIPNVQLLGDKVIFIEYSEDFKERHLCLWEKGIGKEILDNAVEYFIVADINDNE